MKAMMKKNTMYRRKSSLKVKLNNASIRQLLRNPAFADDTVIWYGGKNTGLVEGGGVKTSTKKLEKREKFLLAARAGGFKYSVSNFQNNIEYAR